MKNHIVFLLTIGLNILFGNLVLTQTLSDNTALTESSDSKSNDDILSNNNETEQKNEVLNISTDSVGDDQLKFEENLGPGIDDESLNKSEMEIEKIFNIGTETVYEERPNFGETLDIIVEKIENPEEQTDWDQQVNYNSYNLQNPDDISFGNDIVRASESDYYNEIIQKDPNEIMETAAGFVPIPIFRRRQIHRNQVAARRRYRKPYPYRRMFYYYPYYSFYRPSSLRFY